MYVHHFSSTAVEYCVAVTPKTMAQISCPSMLRFANIFRLVYISLPMRKYVAHVAQDFKTGRNLPNPANVAKICEVLAVAKTLLEAARLRCTNTLQQHYQRLRLEM